MDMNLSLDLLLYGVMLIGFSALALHQVPDLVGVITAGTLPPSLHSDSDLTVVDGVVVDLDVGGLFENSDAAPIRF